MPVSSALNELLTTHAGLPNKLSQVNDAEDLPSLKGSEPTNLTTWEAAAASLLAGLQGEALQLSKEVDTMMLEFQRNGLSKLPQDMATVQSYVGTLSGYLKNMQLAADSHDISKRDGESPSEERQDVVPDDRSSALGILRRLHRVKQRMERSREVLKEAENWSSLSAEMDAIFGSGEFERAAKRLAEAQRSLHLLMNDPDYDDRKKLLSKLLSQLESVLIPQLMAALNEHDTELVKKTFKAFEMVGRQSEVMSFYYRARKSAISEIWSKYDEIAATADFNYLLEWLPTFNEEFFRLVEKEYHWCSTIFPNAELVMDTLLRQAAVSFTPSPRQRLLNLKDQQGPEFWPVVIKCFSSTSELAGKLHNLLSPTDACVIKLHSGKSTNSSDLSDKNARSEEDWVKSMFEPYNPFQMDFAQYEQSFLFLKASQIFGIVETDNLIEFAHRLSESVNNCHKLSKSAILRCHQLTRGFAAEDLVTSLNSFWNEVSTRIHSALLAVSPKKSIDGQDELSKSRSSSASARSPIQDFSLDNQSFHGDLRGNEWSSFQVAIRLLGICSGLSKKLSDLDQVLVRYLIKVGNCVTCLPNKQGDSTNFSILAMEKLYEESDPDNLQIPTSLDVTGESLRYIEIPGKLLIRFQNSFPWLSDPSSLSSVLGPSHASIANVTCSVQRLVFDSLFQSIDDILMKIPTMDAWKSDQQGVTSPFNLNVPQFSMSPSSFITRIGEILLTLPQQMELHADDEALSLSVHGLPYLMKEDMLLEEGLENRDAVMHLWLTSLSRGTMDGLVKRILEIPHVVSTHGLKQILTDLKYIVNVFSAMEIDPIPSLDFLLLLLESKELPEPISESNQVILSAFLKLKE